MAKIVAGVGAVALDQTKLVPRQRTTGGTPKGGYLSSTFQYA